MAQEEQGVMFSDPGTYRAMLEPHGSVEEANAAATAFFDGVKELRKKYRMPNVLIVADVLYLTEDGEEINGRLSSMLGDSVHAEDLAAYAHGYETARRQERHSAMLRQTLKSHRDSAGEDGERKPRKR